MKLQHKRLLTLAVAGAAIGVGLTPVAQAELIQISWTNSNADDLGNGGTNDGVINIPGEDGENTLTITAAGSNGVIAKSSQNGLHVNTGSAAWWTNGGYMDLVFSLTGGADQLTLQGGNFNRFNLGQVATQDAASSGESMVISNMSDGGAVLAVVDHTSVNQVFSSDGLFVNGLGLDIPLGDTIRFEAVNELGGWPRNTWVTRLFSFEATTIPEPSSASLFLLAGATGLRGRGRHRGGRRR